MVSRAGGSEVPNSSLGSCLEGATFPASRSVAEQRLGLWPSEESGQARAGAGGGRLGSGPGKLRLPRTGERLQEGEDKDKNPSGPPAAPASVPTPNSRMFFKTLILIVFCLI